MNWFSNRAKKVEPNKKQEEVPKSTYDFTNQKKDNFEECVICLEDMKYGDQLSIIHCSHMYHLSCLQKWMEKKRICPLCDKSF